ncbi:MAG: DUF4262 domain-containing protein [Rhodocyclaceae bacterium]
MTDEHHIKLMENIKEFGCQVMHIAEEDELPPFAYSVGVQLSTGAPEVIVVGLKQPMAHFVVNEYNRRVRQGERFVPGQLYSGFLEGFDILVSEVHRSQYDEYFGMAFRLYEGPDFDVLQIVWPNTAGVWPWDAEASEWLRQRQPILSHPVDDVPGALEP